MDRYRRDSFDGGSVMKIKVQSLGQPQIVLVRRVGALEGAINLAIDGQQICKRMLGRVYGIKSWVRKDGEDLR